MLLMSGNQGVLGKMLFFLMKTSAIFLAHIIIIINKMCGKSQMLLFKLDLKSNVKHSDGLILIWECMSFNRVCFYWMNMNVKNI